MAVEVILPMLGETMDEATIVKWLVGVGDVVKKGEPIYQVETDKAILDVDAPVDWVVSQILYDAGSKVPVLAVVGMIVRPGEEEPAAPLPPQPRGARIDERPAYAVVGVAQRVLASPRARKTALMQGVDLDQIEGTGPGGRIVERDVQMRRMVQPESDRARASTTPVARKAAAEAGMELAGVHGTGPGGRITRADVAGMTAGHASRIGPERDLPSATMEAGDTAPMTNIRRIIAQRMSASAHTTARVTLTTEVDATEFAHLRASLKDKLQAQLGLAISYTDVLVAIVARALREYPYMNARLLGESSAVDGRSCNGKIQLLSRINVGVAVDTERGLLVPVVRDADRKGIAELAGTLRELVERAQGGKSLPDDLAGGTFTVTNLGMYDIDAFTPIINLPECAILGVGRLREVPAVHQGQVCARTMMALSLTFDHRLVDGAPAARFLQCIKKFVEEPYLLLT